MSISLFSLIKYLIPQLGERSSKFFPQMAFIFLAIFLNSAIPLEEFIGVKTPKYLDKNLNTLPSTVGVASPKQIEAIAEAV